jgi:hypothetical protein
MKNTHWQPSAKNIATQKELHTAKGDTNMSPIRTRARAHTQTHEHSPPLQSSTQPVNCAHITHISFNYSN